MSNRVLVTGACGFIGRNTAKLFADKGWHVTGIGHGFWTENEWKKWGLSEWHESEITLDSLRASIGSVDVIIHCAGSGSVGFSVEHPQQDFHRTLDATVAILEFVRQYTPHSRIVYASSAAVYGATASMPIDESVFLAPISPYGVHKKIAEEMCCSYSQHFSISVTIVRFFSVYGAGLRKQLLWDACLKISNGETTFFGNGKEQRDWLHVNDASSLLYVSGLIGTPGYNIINGGTGVGVSVKKILEELFRCFDRTVGPSFSGEVRSGDPVNYIANIDVAKKLDWKPNISWRDGVHEYAKWFRGGAL